MVTNGIVNEGSRGPHIDSIQLGVIASFRRLDVKRPLRATHSSSFAIGTEIAPTKIGTFEIPSQQESSLQNKCTG